MSATQKNRSIQVFTPLGEDALLFYQMNGKESLSEPFKFELELLSENPAISPEKLLGESISVGILLNDGNWRYFHGSVTRFGYFGNIQNLTRYKVTVNPWLWFLTRNSNCRIFQNKSVPDIIKEVFRDLGFTDFKDKLSDSYSPREYCVQYRETDFNFVSRLMEEEGIYYFFTHEKDRHYLVMTDTINGHIKFSGYEKIPFNTERDKTDKTRTDHIYEWAYAREVQTGSYEMTDYDFKKPKANLQVKSKISKAHAHAQYEFFDYHPGRYTDNGVGEGFVSRRLQEHHARSELCEGQCNARGLAVGYEFKLTEFPLEDQNCEYLVLSAIYSLKSDAYSTLTSVSDWTEPFECNFTASDIKQPYRPARVTPKQMIYGAQTAMVVGPPGEEIHTDEHGRVKVHFHWDRKDRWESGKKEENSSCWIRVSQPWAGKGWGAISIPRIGQEVIVSFLEGDPDQPFITGSAYNTNTSSPFQLPGAAVISGVKSNTHKGKGYNELTMDDTAGKEKITIHGQYDMNTTVEHDQTDTVYNDRTATLNMGNDNLTVEKGNRETNINTGNNTLNIKKGNSITTISSGNHTLEVNKDRTTTLQMGNDTLTVEKGNTTTTINEGNYNLNIDKGNVTIKAAQFIELIVGNSSIFMTNDYIAIISPRIDLNP